MDFDVVQLCLAILAAGFWGPAGIWLICRRHALTVLADVAEETGAHPPRVSVVIPARNEERNIERALQTVLKLDYPDFEVVAVNDRSTDRTGEILQAWAERDRRLTVVTLETAPDGWIGPTYALHRGARQARGELILFTDADVEYHPSALGKAVRHLQANRFDHLTAAFENVMPGVLLNVLSMTFGFFMLMLFAPWKARDPGSRRYMGIGAFNLVRASVYRAVGGHEAVALRPDNDIKFGKLVKDRGYRQDVLNGRGMLAVEWYPSLREFIDGLVKNIFAGIEYRISLVALMAVTSLAVHIWPWIGVWTAAGVAQALFAATAATMVVCFGAVMAPFGAKRWHGVLLPVTIGLLVYIQCRAVVLIFLRGGIHWRGRFYPLSTLKAGRVE